jgi:hypothetical protein
MAELSLCMRVFVRVCVYVHDFHLLQKSWSLLGLVVFQTSDGYLTLVLFSFEQDCGVGLCSF